MRRLTVLLLLPIALLFSACGRENGALSEAVAFRAALLETGGCTFQAEVSADFGETVREFTLLCRAEADGTTDFTVLAPQSVEGITATVTQQGGQITYDGMAMAFGLLADGNVIPAAAPALAVNCWLSAYIVSADEGETVYRMEYDEKALTVTTHFENSVPFFAEVCYNQQRILKITISDFSLAAA